MAFGKFVKGAYPVRQWAIVGYPGDGKSTFGANMKSPILAIDADQRFSEVAMFADEAFPISNSGNHNIDTDLITTLLKENMPNSNVKTIVIDSLTAILEPLVVQAMIDNDKGKNKNRSAAFKEKAMAMRQLQNAITRWGVDTLWVYHFRDGGDSKGKVQQSTSITKTELSRLLRSMNLHLKVVVENGKRGILVSWARRGRSGMTIWDETGTWKGMPDLIEEAVYGGLTEEEQDAIAKAIPSRFDSPEAAIAWGDEQGCFKALQHARNAYEMIKRDQEPSNAQEMADLWIGYVLERKTRGEEEIEEEE